MFLGVSATLRHMQEMTDEQRRRLGVAVRQARSERYETKMAAYQAAGVNSATWDRVEGGESVKERSLIRVLKALWPATSGDWQMVPGLRDDVGYSLLGGSFDDPGYLTRVESWIYELQERVVLLERTVYNREQESGHDTAAATTQAGASPADEPVIEPQAATGPSELLTEPNEPSEPERSAPVRPARRRRPPSGSR